MDPICRIKLLGGLQVWCRGEPVTRFRSRRTVELLAYLACHLRREHPREVLIELFWPDCDLDAGRHSLNVALSSLRKELEPAGVPAGSVLRTDRFGVRLVSEAVSTDVGAFEAAVRAAAEAPPRRRRPTETSGQAASPKRWRSTMESCCRDTTTTGSFRSSSASTSFTSRRCVP